MTAAPRPKVFLAITNPDWFSLARAPKALNEAGFAVAVHCPAGHPVEKSRFVDRLETYATPLSINEYLRKLTAAIEQQRPDLVLAGDDLALAILHRLHRMLAPNHGARAALDASLSPQTDQDKLERKSSQVVIAREAGIAIPPSLIDPGADAAAAFVRQFGFPVLVKQDFTCAGHGVQLCQDPASLTAALGRKPPPFPFQTAIARTLQALVPGIGVLATISAFKGELLGGFAMKKLLQLPLGPTAVAQRLVNEADILDIAAKLVARFGYTGVADLDFILDARNGQPVFIEMNPRWVPLAHLGANLGADVLAPLAARFGASPVPAGARRPITGPIAVFPTEWRRDPNSTHLHASYHDVPWDEPELVYWMGG